MQDPELAGLATAFKDHKEHENAWQDSITADLREIKYLLRPMMVQIQENTQTLYGVGSEKDNGLRGDMKEIEKIIGKMNGHWKTLIAIFVAIQIIFNVGRFAVDSYMGMHTDHPKTEQIQSK